MLTLALGFMLVCGGPDEFDCNDSWTPYINGIQVAGETFHTKEECGAFLEEIDSQTPPFTELSCREEDIPSSDS